MPSRRELANAIRALSMDAVQRANSGHPGMPMGMADIAEVLWRDFLKHNPANPRWAERDRFVLSNGHGSMLLYSVLNLTGYPLALDELRNFRQLGSRTAGHPEHEIEIGIETTTGPLGQGLANAVGMALAEKKLATAFNRPGHEIVDHHTWVFLGDGCLMEGISHEACSLAGTWGLGKLICFYDDNGISIDGEVAGWFTDDTPKRFEAYGWQVIRDVDGHDPEAVTRAIRKAKREKSKPTLICCKTIIGFGAPNKQGKEECHGAALGADEVALARKTLGWPHEPFVIPDEIRAAWDARARGQARGEPLAPALQGLRTGASGTRRGVPAACGYGIARGSRRLDRGGDGRRAGGCEAGRDAPELAGRARRSRRPPAGIPRRLGRSHGLEQHAHQGRGRFLEVTAGRKLSPLRRARIRHGRDHERRRAARRLHPVRRDLPRLLRLRAEFAPHGVDHRGGQHIRADARFHRPRRGRADAPAGRASRVAPHDPPPGSLAALRHGRDLGRLGRRDPPQAGADRARAHAAGAAAAAAGWPAAEGHRARRIRARRLPGPARVHPDRDRIRGLDRD